MSNGFTIEIKGLDKLMEMADRYPNLSEKHVNTAIIRSLRTIKRHAGKKAPSGDTQELRNNWIIKMGRFAGSLESGAKSNGYSYGLAVEFGTKPHFIPVKNNPMFQLWASRRGMNPYAVSRSIGKKGTKAKPFFQPAIEQSQEFVDREFGKALENIINEL